MGVNSLKYIPALLLVVSSLLAVEGTGSYKYPMSDNQSILKVYAKTIGYMNASLTPPSCGTLSIFDHHNKKIPNTFSWGANIKVSTGIYRIIVIPNRGDCTLNVLMPERENNYNDTYEPNKMKGTITIQRSE